jgi:broad specificity phosphatase PhoE
VSARIWLMRHGETEWSRAMRHTGRTDIPLTTQGEAQARAAGDDLRAQEAWREPTLVLCSPLQRARRTAELAGLANTAAHGAATCEIDADLVEWDYGRWEGLTTAQIRTELGDPGWLVWDFPIEPGGTPGEQLDDVAARAARVIARCEPVLAADGDCVLVAHGHFLRILTATWLAMPPIAGRRFALAAAKVSALGFEHETRVMSLWNA